MVRYGHPRSIWSHVIMNGRHRSIWSHVVRYSQPRSIWSHVVRYGRPRSIWSHVVGLFQSCESYESLAETNRFQPVLIVTDIYCRDSELFQALIRRLPVLLSVMSGSLASCPPALTRVGNFSNYGTVTQLLPNPAGWLSTCFWDHTMGPDTCISLYKVCNWLELRPPKRRQKPKRAGRQAPLLSCSISGRWHWGSGMPLWN